MSLVFVYSTVIKSSFLVGRGSHMVVQKPDMSSEDISNITKVFDRVSMGMLSQTRCVEQGSLSSFLGGIH